MSSNLVRSRRRCPLLETPRAAGTLASGTVSVNEPGNTGLGITASAPNAAIDVPLPVLPGTWPIDIALVLRSLPELFGGLFITVELTLMTVLGGLILASGGLNLSRLGFAQNKPSAASVAA